MTKFVPPEQRFLEFTLKLDDAAVDERVLRDIAEFNAQVEVAAQAEGPQREWLLRLT